jgi:hypothetical protein
MEAPYVVLATMTNRITNKAISATASNCWPSNECASSTTAANDGVFRNSATPSAAAATARIWQQWTSVKHITAWTQQPALGMFQLWQRAEFLLVLVLMGINWKQHDHCCHLFHFQFLNMNHIPYLF